MKYFKDAFLNILKLKLLIYDRKLAVLIFQINIFIMSNLSSDPRRPERIQRYYVYYDTMFTVCKMCYMCTVY